MIFEDLEAFKKELLNQEKEENTVRQYSNYINEFIQETGIKRKEDITKQMLIDYKENYLKGTMLDKKTGKEKSRHKTASVNIKVLIINKFISYLQLPSELKLKQEKQQKQTTLEDVLTEKEYDHLREYAKNHRKTMLYCLMGTLEGTRDQNKRVAIYNS